jgi:hypothetical protein
MIFVHKYCRSEAMCRSSPHPRRREGGRGAPGDAQGAACRARGSEAAGRSRSGLRPSCGLRPGRPQRAGGREVAERRTPEGGEERTGAEQSTPEGGMEAGEGGDRGRARRDGGRGRRRREDSWRKTRERKKDRNGTCVTSDRWVIFVTKSR